MGKPVAYEAVADAVQLLDWSGFRRISGGTTADHVEHTQSSSSSGFTWRPAVRRFAPPAKPLRQQLAEATPDNATLLEWARRPESQPPQEWWDDTTDPFALESD